MVLSLGTSSFVSTSFAIEPNFILVWKKMKLQTVAAPRHIALQTDFIRLNVINV